METNFLTNVSELKKKKYSKQFHKIQFPKDASVFLPYVGKFSFSTRSNLKKKNIWDTLFFCQFKSCFQNQKLNPKFMFTDKISKEKCFLLCCKFQCSSCNASYYGKTKCHFKVRVSAPSGKSIKSTTNSAVWDHVIGD